MLMIHCYSIVFLWKWLRQPLWILMKTLTDWRLQLVRYIRNWIKTNHIATLKIGKFDRSLTRNNQIHNYTSLYLLLNRCCTWLFFFQHELCYWTIKLRFVTFTVKLTFWALSKKLNYRITLLFKLLVLLMYLLRVNRLLPILSTTFIFKFNLQLLLEILPRYTSAVKRISDTNIF